MAALLALILLLVAADPTPRFLGLRRLPPRTPSAVRASPLQQTSRVKPVRPAYGAPVAISPERHDALERIDATPAPVAPSAPVSSSRGALLAGAVRPPVRTRPPDPGGGARLRC